MENLWQIGDENVADEQDTRLDGLTGADEKQAAADRGDGGASLPFLGFLGSYTHGIDAKGRMIIPASFREPLGSRFAVCPTPDFKAVALYPIDGWIKRRDELLSLLKIDARLQPLVDQFSKYSFADCESDAQGRLLLPQKIRAWRLGDAREVDVNGAVSHVRILPASVSREQDRHFDETFDDVLGMIAEIQKKQSF